MPELVGRERLMQANARRQTIIGVIELVGPLLAGGILDRVGLQRWGDRLRRPGLELFAYAAGALVWVGYALSASFKVVLGLSFLDGLVYTGTATLFETRVQAEAPKDAVGRVYAVALAVDRGGSVLGCILGGLVATFWTIQAGFLTGIGATTETAQRRYRDATETHKRRTRDATEKHKRLIGEEDGTP
jgi:Na+/glutamate symporter